MQKESWSSRVNAESLYNEIFSIEHELNLIIPRTKKLRARLSELYKKQGIKSEKNDNPR